MSKTYYVYILASRKNGTLYIGMTNDIARMNRSSALSPACQAWAADMPSRGQIDSKLLPRSLSQCVQT